MLSSKPGGVWWSWFVAGAALADDPTLPAPLTVEAGASGYEMVLVPPGKFTWVDPAVVGPSEAYEVRVAADFWLGRHEVTQGLWKQVTGDNPATGRRVWPRDGRPVDLGPCASYQDESLVGDDLPVMCVSWCDAVLFANELSRREGLEPVYETDPGLKLGASYDWCAQTAAEIGWSTEANGYRLPTEAEWEHAARAGGDDLFAGADSERAVCGVANVADRAAVGRWPAWESTAPCYDGVVGLASAGSFGPNPWGFQDLSGNVAEWVWDIGGAVAGRATTGGAAARDAPRVYRGGCWAYDAAEARVSARAFGAPGGRYLGLGLRLARSLDRGEMED